MNIKISTNINKKYDDTEIIINANDMTDEIKKLIGDIYNLTNNNQKIMANLDNQIYLINPKDIYYFYSFEKYNYCKTKDNSYKIKDTLYSLEEQLQSKKFIRISNSYIVNLEKVKCFDISKISNIVVILENNEQLIVSKRRIKDVMKYLKQGSGKNE